jgi:hypothetical protein
MKTKIFATLFVTAVAFISCSKNSDDTASGNTAQAVAQTVTTAGNWRVSLFNDSGNNETADFTGYSFTFNGDGSIVASKNATNTNGTWTTNVSSNKFIIDLGPKIDTNKPLGELTDDWRVVSVTSNEIQLKDDNNTEFLTFTKN